MKNTMLDHALFYIKQGLPIFPVGWDAKHLKKKTPLVAWAKFQTELPTEDQVKDWWAKWPDASIGMATGRLSGLVVIDAEYDADFNLFGLNKLETPRAKSGGGGKHYYFKYEPLKNAVGFARSYDVRGDGGYIVLPPSEHHSGNHYEWENPIGEFEPQPFPEIINLKLAEKPKVDLTRALVSTTPDRQRNNTSASVAGLLLVKYNPDEWEQKAWPLLQGWNKSFNNPPLDEKELRLTFESIAKKELARHQEIEKDAAIFKEDLYVPKVDKLENEDSYNISENIEDGIVQLIFSDVEQARSKEIEALLNVVLLVPGSFPKPFSGRINILSMSAKEGFARSLAKCFGKDIKWDLILSSACSKVHSLIANKDYSVVLSQVSLEAEKYLLEPYLTDNAPNLLFGMGGSGKTFVALRLAISVASGVDLLGCTPVTTGNVLFVDYEASASALAHRVSLLLGDVYFRGIEDIGGVMDKFHYLKPMAPLADSLPAIKKVIADNDIKLVIVDSAAAACGTEPERAESAIRYFNALASLKVATLTIAHESKAENTKQPFGSIFWYNFPRNIWNIQREPAEESKVINSGLFHRKSNDDMLRSGRAVRIFFGNGFIEMGNGSMAPWEKEIKVPKRLLYQLSSQPMTLEDFESAMPDVGKKTLKQTLWRLKKDGKVIDENHIWKRLD